MSWISIQDKKFPKKGSFLLSRENYVYFATWDQEGEFYVVASSLDYGCLDNSYDPIELAVRFKHWMPLPKPHKEIR